MKAFGHDIATFDTEVDTLIELGEVSIEASPKKLRKLAKFLLMCADEADSGNGSDHYHYNNNARTRPQFVVCIKPKAS